MKIIPNVIDNNNVSLDGKKVGICLLGIHYMEGYPNMDFRISLEHIKTNYVKHLESKGCKVYIFLSTYESPIIDKLLEAYNPYAYKIAPTSEITNGHAINRLLTHHLNCAKLIEESKDIINLDFVMTSRFDVFTNFPLFMNNTDFSRFNTVFRHRSGNCDFGILIYPINYHKKFKEAIEKMIINNCTNAHEFNNWVNNDIHYLYTGFPETFEETTNLYKFSRQLNGNSSIKFTN
jgi:hypothetical protein